MRNKKKEDRYWMMRQIGLLTMIPLLLAVSPIIGLFIGRFLDGKLNTAPVFMIIFIILGFVAGARQVASVVKKAQEDVKHEDDIDGI